MDFLHDLSGSEYTLSPDRLWRPPICDYPGAPSYSLYLRAADLAGFFLSGARAWFIPVFHGDTDRVWGNYVIALDGGRLAVAGWRFGLDETRRIQTWCHGTPAVQLDLEELHANVA